VDVGREECAKGGLCSHVFRTRTTHGASHQCALTHPGSVCRGCLAGDTRQAPPAAAVEAREEPQSGRAGPEPPAALYTEEEEEEECPDFIREKLRNPRLNLAAEQKLRFLQYCINTGAREAAKASQQDVLMFIGNTGEVAKAFAGKESGV